MDLKVICVVGASGFIGSHLLLALKGRGVELRVLSRTGVHDGSYSHIGDLLDFQSLNSFCAGAQILINLAQPSDSVSDLCFTEGMNNLARASKLSGIQRILHVSTAMVVGIAKGDIVDESSACYPQTIYERRKLHAEEILLSELASGVDIGILRPTAVFGTGGQNLRKLMGVLENRTLVWRHLLRFFHGQRHMHLVSVKDVVDALVFLTFLLQPLGGNVFLITADDEPQNQYQEVDSILGNALGRSLEKTSTSLPRGMLQVMLRLAGRSQSNPKIVFDAEKLKAWGFQRKSNFEAELRDFAIEYHVKKDLL